jgi:hypothetical protein
MGASALVNSARAVLSLDTLAQNDAGKVGVVPCEAARYFRLLGVKGNLSPPSSNDRWYELKSGPLNNGTPTYPSGDNVQVVAPFTPRPAASVFPQSDIKRYFFRAICANFFAIPFAVREALSKSSCICGKSRTASQQLRSTRD